MNSTYFYSCLLVLVIIESVNAKLVSCKFPADESGIIYMFYQEGDKYYKVYKRKNSINDSLCKNGESMHPYCRYDVDSTMHEVKIPEGQEKKFGFIFGVFAAPHFVEKCM
ncbi:hypothetical protein DdX_19960 [Ditylenchus destructor]|uniref:Uncharacterized protein n=1 Tax=Ditylenchus destructor TaxID=166010 RepID=A0AAD4MLN7_9BILA|nr:hypothetical protein DdX_19960 [Ditylenchus destructor]